MEGIRLPKWIRPIHYDLYIDFEIGSYDYSGLLTIELKTESPTDQVFLHAAKQFLKISEIRLTRGSESEQILFEHVNHDTIQIQLPETQSGVFYLTCDFSGEIQCNGEAFFEGEDSNNTIYATHMQPVFARKVFP
jgi:aminopeptidase N